MTDSVQSPPCHHRHAAAYNSLNHSLRLSLVYSGISRHFISVAGSYNRAPSYDNLLFINVRQTSKQYMYTRQSKKRLTSNWAHCSKGVRRILVRGVNAPLVPDAKKIWKI